MIERDEGEVEEEERETTPDESKRKSARGLKPLAQLQSCHLFWRNRIAETSLNLQTRNWRKAGEHSRTNV